MTEHELVEALARRLAHVTHANPQYPDAAFDQDWELYVDAARECIRQMEWVRWKVCEEITDARMDAPRWALETLERAETKPLTLAPEDWTP